MATYPGKYLEGSTRQLQDLRMRPSATMIRTANGAEMVADERPHFDLGELPVSHPDYGLQPPWKQLLWHPTSGDEVCAINQSEVNSLRNRGYVDFPIHGGRIDPVTAAQEDFQDLTADERKRVLDAVKQQKIKALQDRLMKLSEAELEQIATTPDKTRTA